MRRTSNDTLGINQYTIRINMNVKLNVKGENQWVHMFTIAKVHYKYFKILKFQGQLKEMVPLKRFYSKNS